MPSHAVVELWRAGDLPPIEWSGLASRGFHLQRWFEVAEMDAALEPRHLVVSLDGRARVVVPAYLESTGLHGDLHDRWLGPARRFAAAAGLRLRPTLAVGAPFATTSDPLGDLDELPDDALDEVLRRLEERARRDRARAVVWPFVGPRQASLLRAARRRGYVSAFAGSTAILVNRWSSLDEYVASRSKHVRRTIRAEREALGRDSLDVVPTADFARAAPQMDALYREWFVRRNGRAPRLDPRFFQRLATVSGRDVWAQLTRRRDRLVAMSVNLAAGGTLDGGFAAYAPGELGGPVYFNDAIYEPIRVACARGLARIDLGPGALYPKVLRGAELRPRFSLAWGTSAAARASLRGLGTLVDRRNRRKERRAVGGFTATPFPPTVEDDG